MTGRPAKYDPDCLPKVSAWAGAGATDREIAEYLEIGETTLYRWRHEYPEFREALAMGKEFADERVEKALYRRAIGYTFDAVKIMQHQGQEVIIPYQEHIPPDTSAAMAWLKNRKPAVWRDKQEVEHSGNVTVEIVRFSDADQTA